MAGPAARRWWQLGSQFPRLPTVYDAHQRAVPRLPIPTLEESCAKYLRHLAPLQSAAEHGATRRAVEATLDSTIARDVQAALVRADAELPSDSSYLESLWYKAAYLGGRDSIAVHSNPGLLFKPTHTDPLWSAATMLAACADWECRLRRGSLPPALTPSGQPLCMALLPQVFGCARMPEAENRVLEQVKSAHKLSLVHLPNRPDQVLQANPVLDATEAAPRFTDSWSQMRERLEGFIRARKLPGSQVVIVGDAPLEADWMAAARAAGYLPASEYFPHQAG